MLITRSLRAKILTSIFVWLAEFVLAVKRLLCNPIYMVTCLGACMELAIVSGFVVYLPKYLETQFSLGKSQASVFTGSFGFSSLRNFQSFLSRGCFSPRMKFAAASLIFDARVIQEALRYPAPASASSWAAVCSRGCSSSPRDSSSSSSSPTSCACRCTRCSSS